MLGAEKFLFFVYCDAIFEYLHRVCIRISLLMGTGWAGGWLGARWLINSPIPLKSAPISGMTPIIFLQE